MEDVRFSDDKVMVDCYHYEALKMLAIGSYGRGECSRCRIAKLLQCSLFHLDEAIEHHKEEYPEIQQQEVERALERVEEAKRRGRDGL